MSEQALTRRMARRETRSSRAGASIATAAVLILLLAWLGTESVLAMGGRPPLLAAPTGVAGLLAQLPAAIAPWGLVAAGTVLAVLGLLLLVLAVSPGTRPRHAMSSSRSAVVVDDEVIAAAVSRAARQAGSLVPDQVSARVRRRRVEVHIRPIAGGSVDEAGIRAAVDRELASAALDPEPKLSITVSRRGEAGG